VALEVLDKTESFLDDMIKLATLEITFTEMEKSLKISKILYVTGALQLHLS